MESNRQNINHNDSGGGLPSVNPSFQNLSTQSPSELISMAHRQHAQIERQQRMLVMKEQRLKYLRQQDLHRQRVAKAEYEKLAKLRQKVESQEMKLRQLRANRSKEGGVATNGSLASTSNEALILADLDSIRKLFAEKEAELKSAVSKVDDLRKQLDKLHVNRSNVNYNHSSSHQNHNSQETNNNQSTANMLNQTHKQQQIAELERLRRELAYRRALNEQQNKTISEQRDQLARGQEEMMKIDNRIVELRSRLDRKRAENQNLQKQINGVDNNNSHPVLSCMEHHGQEAHPSVESNNKNSISKAVVTPTNNAVLQAPPSTTNSNSANFPIQCSSVVSNQRPISNKPISTVEPFERSKPSSYDSIVNITSSSSSVQQRFTAQNAVGSSRPVSSVAPVTTASSGGGGGKVRPALPPKPSTSSIALYNNQQSSYVISQPPPLPVPSTSTTIIATSSQVEISRNEGSSIYSNSCEIQESTTVTKKESMSDDIVLPLPLPLPTSQYIHTNDEFNANGNVCVEEEVNDAISEAMDNHDLQEMKESSENIDTLTERQSETNGNCEESGTGSSSDEDDLLDMFGRVVMTDATTGGPIIMTSQEVAKAAAKAEAARIKKYIVPKVIYEPDVKYPGSHIISYKSIVSCGSRSGGREGGVSFDPLALLLDAALEGELDLVKMTARQVADPSASNDEGITALHNAICAGHYDIVQFLVGYGCDVNCEDSDGWTPLHCAASCNNLEMVRFLVEHGACIHATTYSDQETAAQKCEEDEDGYVGCSEYLYNIQEDLGVSENAKVYSVYEYDAFREDELNLKVNDTLTVIRRGECGSDDENNNNNNNRMWWLVRNEVSGMEGYVPLNYLGKWPRVSFECDRTDEQIMSSLRSQLLMMDENYPQIGEENAVAASINLHDEEDHNDPIEMTVDSLETGEGGGMTYSNGNRLFNEKHIDVPSMLTCGGGGGGEVQQQNVNECEENAFIGGGSSSSISQSSYTNILLDSGVSGNDNSKNKVENIVRNGTL